MPNFIHSPPNFALTLQHVACPPILDGSWPFANATIIVARVPSAMSSHLLRAYYSLFVILVKAATRVAG